MNIVNRYKIINLVGRYKFVREACEDIYDCALSMPAIRGNIQILHSNPKTQELTLRPFVDFYRFKGNETPKLIIHCFPCTSYKNLEDLNKYIDTKSIHIFEKMNLFVHQPPIEPDYREDILSRRTLYNDLYCTNDPYEHKQMKIMKYILKQESDVR